MIVESDYITILTKNLPSHWETYRIGNVFVERTEKVSDKDFAPLSVTMKGIVPQLENIAKTTNGDNRKKVCENDFAINSRSDRKGSGGMSKYDGSVSLINTVLKPNQKYHNRYTNYLLTNVLFQEEFYKFGKGIVDDMWSTKYFDMKYIKVPCPPKNEQIAIANYLDSQSKKIKHFIKKKQTFIELLNEQRESVINKAVTKGSNPNVKLKDSGIVWLGKIPENWERTALKRLVSTKITDGPHETPNFVDDGIPFVSAEAAYGGRICIDRKRGFITPELHKEYSKKVLPQFGDIFIVKSGSTTGKTVIVDIKEEFNIWSPLALVRTNELINNEFMLFALQSEYFQHQVQQNWSFGTQPNIGMKVLEKLFIKFPKDIEEQKRIVSKIKTETAKIDQAIAKAQKEIELIKEYKEAMIAEAVLGKLNHKIKPTRANNAPVENIKQQ